MYSLYSIASYLLDSFFGLTEINYVRKQETDLGQPLQQQPQIHGELQSLCNCNDTQDHKEPGLTQPSQTQQHIRGELRSLCNDDMSPQKESCNDDRSNHFTNHIISSMPSNPKSVTSTAPPMDEVLPHDIVQCIVGLNDDLRHIELVNKTFHKCCKSAQRLLLRQQETVWQKEFNQCINNNRIINVYPSPHNNTLALAIQHAKSGDTLLIHKGVYQLQPGYEVNKSIKLIGYGCNVDVTININTSYHEEIKFNAQNIYIGKLTFHIAGSLWFSTCTQGSIYLENCVLDADALELSSKNSEIRHLVKIKNCFLINGRVRREPELREMTLAQLLTLRHRALLTLRNRALGQLLAKDDKRWIRFSRNDGKRATIEMWRGFINGKRLQK
eukprot:207085_1